MIHLSWRTFFGGVVMLACLWASGCSSKPMLMPTPNLYRHAELNPFADVPPSLQGNRMEVLYITDRMPEPASSKVASEAAAARYGKQRSRSAAYGVAEVQVGDDELTWDQLVEESRSARRKRKMELSVVSARELGRFAPTPPKLVLSDEELNRAQSAAPGQSDVEKQFLAELTGRLARTPRKEVYLFVHGFNVGFEGSILTLADLWHFLGREGVPIAYSWPAGKGNLRGYEYTNQSAQFTMYHLKQAMLLIAACPAVEKVHIIAHSRGTAVSIGAVRELYMELRRTEDVRAKLKLGACALAAADLDIDVVIGQHTTERTAWVVDSVAIYSFKEDKALAFSNWLSGGWMRLGTVDAKLFTREEVDTLRAQRKIQFVDARISKPGSFGHSYYQANPAVSSDLILYLRYQLPPGGEDGRPLGVSKSGFWMIEDEYPGPISAPWARVLRRP